MPVWIVVADSSKARMFEHDRDTDELREFESLVHPASRQHRRDMEADAPGLKYSTNHAGRHTAGTARDPHEQATLDFAREVVDYLETARVGGSFRHLHVVAAPQFLGLMRTNYSHSLAEMIRWELSKELSHLDARAIRGHLPDAL